LVEDLIAVTTSFSARIYEKRGGRVAKKLSKVIESEVTTSEDNGDGDNPGTDS
jgi:predicted site-specific integrase-resolvase